MNPTPGLSVEIHAKRLWTAAQEALQAEKASWDSDPPDYECVDHNCTCSALAVCGKTCSDFSFVCFCFSFSRARGYI